MMLVDDVGLWCDATRIDFGGRPALFLDRDGVVVEDTDYLARPEDVRVIAGAASAIARCNQLGIPVVVVTNQSGIGRGYYDWNGFQAVQAAISAALAAAGGQFDAVLACAYHSDANDAYRIADHPWRKPKPGMILEAVRRMRLDSQRSWIIGDRAHDIEAGRKASLAGGVIVLTGHGHNERAAALNCASDHFAVETASTLADAITLLLARGLLKV